MRKEQTFVICVYGHDGRSLDFERWAYKKPETCIKRMVELYASHSIFELTLKDAAEFVAYPTPDGYHYGEPVWRASIDEFRDMMEKHNEEKYRKRELARR